MTMTSFWLHVFLVQSLVFTVVQSNFIVVVQPKTSECFVEMLNKDVRLDVSYSVSEGGNRDIDIKIVGPHGLDVLEKKQSHDGLSEVVAYADGEYTYCFDNTWSTHTAKTVIFAVERDDVDVEDIDQMLDDKEETLSQMISGLQHKLTACRHEQEFMRIRLALHKETTENTNRMVLLWSVFECVVMLVMAGLQVYHVKRMFEIQTVV
eukprot:CFRG4759T1